MTFEEFIIHFGNWYAGGRLTACLVGIRAAESLNRWMSVASARYKNMFGNRRWTTKVGDCVYNGYPIYDWKTEDIWTYCGKYHKPYNRLYDRFFQSVKCVFANPSATNSDRR